ncbi:hypothetical protein D3C81_1566590 [compost metagenome]
MQTLQPGIGRVPLFADRSRPRHHITLERRIPVDAIAAFIFLRNGQAVGGLTPDFQPDGFTQLQGSAMHRLTFDPQHVEFLQTTGTKQCAVHVRYTFSSGL